MERLWNRFTIAVDVIGHELTHGVTQYEANLTYRSQSGALNESFSDVFGSLVKQRLLGHTADHADWLIGQGLFTANVNGIVIFSRAVGKRATMENWGLAEALRPRDPNFEVTSVSIRGNLRIILTPKS